MSRRRDGLIKTMQPKCRLCGAKHWSYEPHVFQEKPEKPVTEQKESSTTVVNDVHNRVNRLTSSLARRAYMREYMRRKRAKGDIDDKG